MYWWSSQKYYTKTYNKGLFDSFENEDQISESYLVFSDKYSVEKHGTEIKDQMVYIPIRLKLINNSNYFYPWKRTNTKK